MSRPLVLLIALVILLGGGRAHAAEGDRLVALGGSVTETVAFLGAFDRLVAVDSTSLHPPAATGLPGVGYLRALGAEAIVARRPRMVLALEGAGPPVVLDQMRAAGVLVALVPEAASYDGVIAKLRQVAELVGREAEGQRLAALLRADFDQLDALVGQQPGAPRVLFILAPSSGAPLVAGRDTSAEGIIRLAGGQNAVTDFTGFKPLSPEAALAAAPEVILVTRHLGAEDEGRSVMARPELAATPAGRNGRIAGVDALKLLGFGPRTGIAVRELAGLLHPDLALPPMSAELSAALAAMEELR